MMRTMLKSKIHRAMVTDANLEYEGSITVDGALMDAADILEYEKVQIVNLGNGERFETYVMRGEPESGQICINGAAARLAHKGDRIIVMSFVEVEESEAAGTRPKVVAVDVHNRPVDSRKTAKLDIC